MIWEAWVALAIGAELLLALGLGAFIAAGRGGRGDDEDA